MSRNSRTPSWAFLVTVGVGVDHHAVGDRSMHEGWSAGPRPVSTSTMHMRHMPTGFMRGW
jgi:hypothetical protein